MAETDAESADAVRKDAQLTLTHSLALIGFMGIGKTTVGAELSRRLGWPALDTDSEIESRSNMTIREIFDWLGEPHFRELEQQVIELEAVREKRVLSLGGGAFMQERNRRILLRSCTVVYLAAPWSYVARSVQRLKNTRPLLRGRSSAELEKLFATRHPVYNLAQVRVSVPGRTPAQVATRILELTGLAADTAAALLVREQKGLRNSEKGSSE